MTPAAGTPGARKDLAWTPEEDDLLCQHYAERGASALKHLMPHRSVHAIRKRAERLDLVRTQSKGHALGIEEIGAAMARHRGSVIRAATHLGVATTSLRRRADHFGITIADAKPHWNGAELACLRAIMTQSPEGTSIDTAQFPGRSKASIKRQLRRLRAAVATQSDDEATTEPL